MTYKYYQDGDFWIMEIKAEGNTILMSLDPLDAEHIQIIKAIGESETKALKYAIYLSSGGCDFFYLQQILDTINS
jgi:hypothetical protein